jgi:glycogen(starch) synthase
VRILGIGSMYPPHSLGGQEIVWRHATLHQRAAGHVARVLTTDWRRPDLPADAEWDRDVHRELRWWWRDHEFPRLGLRDRLALERHNARTLERHLDELRPDAVVWWSGGGMSLSLIEQVRRTGVPALGVVGDDWFLYGPVVDQWTRMFARRPWLAPLGRLAGVPTRFDPGPAGRWLFVSDFVRRRALERYELPDTGIIHPGIDPSLLHPAPPQPWAWRLLCLGRIDPRKGIELAVRALAELPREATLAVVGAGDDRHRSELRALAAELGLEGRVSFAEATREELQATYARCDALLFPVLWEEPWGLVPIEAMAVGRPVVASGRGGSAEFLRDERNCLLFDPDDGPGALAAAVRRLAADPALRERLVAGGRETAAELTQDRFNDALLDELARLVGGGRRAVTAAA